MKKLVELLVNTGASREKICSGLIEVFNHIPENASPHIYWPWDNDGYLK
jgi:hypothetical protein